MRQAERGFGAGRAVIASLVGSLAIALAGCGGDDGMGATGSTSNAGTSSAPTVVADTAPPADTGESSTGGGSTTGGTSAVQAPPVASSSASTSVSLAWVPPTQNSDGSPITNLAGYKIHYGTASSDYTEMVAVSNAGLTRYVLDNLKSGTYYFAITAYNAQGMESPLSGEISTTVD